MRIRNIIMAMSMALVLVACATTQNYSRIVNSWRGARVSTLYQKFGYPDKIIRLSGGHKVSLYYEFSADSYRIYKCITGFESNRRGVVVAVRHRGNDCRSNAIQMRHYLRKKAY